MNIQEAKEQIKNAMVAYFSKDEFGNYEIPVERQRPVFLVGAPGIGKTAIMEQIAQELDVGLVAYSMTHHTRQSALGLPFIVRKSFGGVEVDVSEYTMSEIIASVYECIVATGRREGMLFLDEINCVSETLTPSMLQFLQFKTFGRHRIPDGWIVVTAGNPPEYNRSVREFDIVTMDRLKRIDVKPDFDAWKEYACARGVHAAVLTYLEIKKQNFYSVETTVEGKRFVTARGWDDLSQMIRLCEKHGLPVDQNLVRQYLQTPGIARDFAAYYDLFNRYRADYQVDDILAGRACDGIKDRARAAHFDERLALLGLLLEQVTAATRAVTEEEDTLLALLPLLKAVDKPGTSLPPIQLLEQQRDAQQAQLETGQRLAPLSKGKRRTLQGLIAALETLTQELTASGAGAESALQHIKQYFAARTAGLKARAEAVGAQLEQLFLFCEEVFPDGQELLILVTELTLNAHSSLFISRYGCPKYFQHNRELLFYERQQEIVARLEALDWEDRPR